MSSKQKNPDDFIRWRDMIDFERRLSRLEIILYINLLFTIVSLLKILIG